MKETDRILKLLNKTFTIGAWHGPTVRQVLKQVTSDLAHARVGDSHSIIGLVMHMTAWRTFVTRRLEGDGSYQVTDAMNFPDAKSVTWADAVQGLEDSQEKLIAAAGRFPEERLGELVPSITHKYTYYTMLHGIIHHDLYHIGQIQLLLKGAARPA